MKALKSLSILCLVISSYSFSQEITDLKLIEKIQELERRISLLEKIVLEESKRSTAPAQLSVSPNKVDWRKLRVGMTENEVRQILGEPTRVSRISADYCSWHYLFEEDPIGGMIGFDKKGVSSWREPN